MKITVFTPTYNRAYKIKELYDSLCSQTFRSFEWVIVNDGSIDNTDAIIESFKKDGLIKINYLVQENCGKHIAINKGLHAALGELFYIVDSDDTVPPESLQNIWNKYQKIKDNNTVAGVVGRIVNSKFKLIGTPLPEHEMNISGLQLRYQYKIQGDLSEVFKTEILKQYPFPYYENEKFCTEALIWNRIYKKYTMLFFDEPILTTEYLPDGLTASSFKIRKNSPIATTNYYKELFYLDIPFKYKLKAAINYLRFSRYLKNKRYSLPALYLLMAAPFALALAVKDECKI